MAGRVVAITGAARGIGLAIAETLAGRGALVALGDLDGELAEREAERLGGSATGLRLDVTDTDSFRVYLEAVERAYGRPVDVLVNNAGIMWVGRFQDESESTALRQMNVNFHGVMRGMKLAIPRMRAAGSGHVVNIASAASRFAPAGEASYAATKHAVLGYSTAVRDELKGSGVQISVVMPVVVETQLAAGTSHGRAVRLQPQDVADAVLATIERPRFQVFVPRNIDALARLVDLLPQRGRDMVRSLMMPDQVTDTDHAARSEYERRMLGG